MRLFVALIYAIAAIIQVIAALINGHRQKEDQKARDAVSHYDRAISANRRGSSSEAIAECNRAIALNPQYVDAYFYRGLIKGTESDTDGAITDFDRVIALAPNYPDALTTRARHLYLKGDHDRVIADCDKAIVFNPNDAEAYFIRAWAKESKGDNDGAIDDYDVAARLNPGDAAIFFHRGLTKFILIGDNSESHADFLRAVTLDPEYGARVMDVMSDESNHRPEE